MPGTRGRGDTLAPPSLLLPDLAPASSRFASSFLSCFSPLLTRRLSHSDTRRRSVMRGGRTGGRCICAAARQRASELCSSARSSTHTSCTCRVAQGRHCSLQVAQRAWQQRPLQHPHVPRVVRERSEHGSSTHSSSSHVLHLQAQTGVRSESGRLGGRAQERTMCASVLSSVRVNHPHILNCKLAGAVSVMHECASAHVRARHTMPFQH